MKIGELSRASGASPRSLRYYEELGLISSVRQPNGYRDYDEQTVAVVSTIKSLLDLGFPMTLIERVLPCTGDAGPLEGECSGIMARVAEIRDEMEDKARRLLETRDALTAFLRNNGQ
ncbi:MULTISPECIES: MerR family transcriptional regulator [Amycolatopsis]|uniref:DNA-binding transcriptional regulator, MerR family n=2 Tax=Amycolatopsis TaxID=1813 RepID=A0A1I4D285_9PSEU|nr:MerR family transcriptional regulator [Amycolatopsis sacchari]SFK87612.1 DNA-binding transcriptional regulator, MerR family [Amycolatopsis sacchari]